LSTEALIARLKDVLSRIEFEGYTWEAREAHGGVVVLGTYTEPDTYTGVPEQQSTRKWLVSPHMTDSEIVQTVFKLCATSMEHRLREHFTYRGRRVFGPHFDVEDLVGLCKDRENAGGRAFS
jgi:hypothetical protein